MKWHSFKEEEPEGNVYNPYAFLIRTPNRHAKSENDSKYLYKIAYWQDGHWSHNIEEEELEWICIDTEL